MVKEEEKIYNKCLKMQARRLEMHMRKDTFKEKVQKEGGTIEKRQGGQFEDSMVLEGGNDEEEVKEEV